ncbi:hypothetical protein [Nocardioides sp.]|uniref:hypothetical protein n=1 Tax=Nocardioides sp. TaxID=35761 RepID=UPI003514C679
MNAFVQTYSGKTEIVAMLRWLDPGHLPEAHPAREVFAALGALVKQVLPMTDGDPEAVAGVRKLIEAKDCFVRAAVRLHEEQGA